MSRAFNSLTYHFQVPPPPVRDSNAAAPVARFIGGHASGASSPDHSQPQAPSNASGSLKTNCERRSCHSPRKEKVQTLEEFLTEQKILKQDVKFLKEFMKERRRDLEIRAVEETMNHDHDQILRGRSF